MWLVTIISWLQDFLCPFIICVAIGLGITKVLSIISIVIGGIAGIVLAEYIRRKFGLDVFFGRLYGRNEMADKLTKKD